MLSVTATGTALGDRQLGSRNWEKGLVVGPVGQVLVSGVWTWRFCPGTGLPVLQGRGGTAVPAPLDLLSGGFLSLIRGARYSPQRPLPPTVLTGEHRRLGPAVINCCTERGPSFFHLLIYLSTPFGLSYSHLTQGPRTCWLSLAQGQRVQSRKLSNFLSNFHSRSFTAPHADLKACWCPRAGWGYSSAGTSLWPS